MKEKLNVTSREEYFGPKTKIRHQIIDKSSQLTMALYIFDILYMKPANFMIEYQ